MKKKTNAKPVLEKLKKFLDVDFDEYSGFSNDDLDGFFVQYFGKDRTAIKESNDFELFGKALVINAIIERVARDWDEDILAQDIGCKQCPDELLEDARKRAMGIGK